MKILSDFDGVLTDLTHEVRRVREIYLEVLRSVSSDLEVTRMIACAEERMGLKPHLYGWRVNGRISAYCNEDGFIRVNALGACLDDMVASEESDAILVLESLRSKEGVKDYCELAQKSYYQMTAETASSDTKPIDPDAASTIRSLHAKGVEIVVVSNSGTERILDILSRGGLFPVAHGAGEGNLRVRGNARKFVLGDNPSSFHVGDYRVDTDRPLYEAILREERPDLVIGDVFSLDLALPSTLGITPVLRKRNYTPSWALEHCLSGPAKSNQEVRGVIIDKLDELVSLT